MTVKELCQKLGWSLFCGDGSKEIKGCYIGDLLSRVMGNCSEGDLWITVQTSQNMVAVAVLADVACVLFPEGIKISSEVLSSAKEQGLTVVGSDAKAFSLACQLGDILWNGDIL